MKRKHLLLGATSETFTTTYMFETAVKTDGDAGIIAWWKDVDNNAYIGFDTKNHNWYLRTIINGKEKGRNISLA